MSEESARTQIAFLIIGDEVLSRSVRETNLDYGLLTASRYGYTVGEVRMLGDSIPDIASALRDLSPEKNLVITSGGVGPTHDDVTMEAVAVAFGVPLTEESRMLRFLQRQYGEELSPAVKSMAFIPQGTVVEIDDDIHWPLLRCRNCCILPGLPQAFRSRIDRIFAALPAQPPVSAAAVYTDYDESVFADHLTALQTAHPEVEIGSYPEVPREAGYAARVTVKSRDAAAVQIVYDKLLVLFGGKGWLKRSQDPQFL
ncbi:MAG: competence/damage-inducible protein A [Spirochaeta sp.]